MMRPIEISAGIQLLSRKPKASLRDCRRREYRRHEKLIDSGHIDRNGVTVIAITGNGLKTPDAVPFNRRKSSTRDRLLRAGSEKWLMSLKVLIPTPLRKHTAGAEIVSGRRHREGSHRPA
jgi:hypothetical protein